jgi:hypothetical protein
MKTFLKSAGLLGLVSAGFVLAPNAASALSPCPDGMLGQSTNVAGLTALGSMGCSQGDKIYADFKFDYSADPGFSAITSGTYNFTNAPQPEHTFSGSGLALLAGKYKYTYSVTVTSAESFDAYATGISTSNIGGTFTGFKSLQTVAPGLVSGPISSGGMAAEYDIVPPYGTKLYFESIIMVDAGRVDVITDSITQTPGPLPILGAGAAFGFSRKVRRRIQASA